MAGKIIKLYVIIVATLLTFILNRLPVSTRRPFFCYFNSILPVKSTIMFWLLMILYAFLALGFAQAGFCFYLVIKYRHRYDVANRWFGMYIKRNWSFRMMEVIQWPVDLIFCSVLFILALILSLIALAISRDEDSVQEVKDALLDLTGVIKKRLFGK